MKHIFSVATIVQKIEKNKGVANLYEKVNQILKGAVTGSPELIEEVDQIISSEVKNIKAQLANAKKKMQPVEEKAA